MRSLGPSRSLLGESPIWVPERQALCWLDLRDPTFLMWTEGAGEVRTPLPLSGPLGPLVATSTPGVVVLSDTTGLHALDLASGATRPLGDFSSREHGTHANDGKIDAQGRFWVSTADDEELAATGGLHVLSPADDGRIDGRRLVGGFVVSNGPAFSSDGTEVYFSDSDAGRVLAFPLHPDGSLGEARLVHRFDDAYPDGLTVDADGDLWVALWHGGRVVRLTPGGDLVETLEVPGLNVTSVVFGGPDYETLFITTARKGMTEEELAAHPGSGGSYAIEPGVRGLPEPVWPHAV